jgi:hypothetical protein
MEANDIRREYFPEWFDFARPTAAPHRNAAGALVMAAVDSPRFDYDGDGTSLGLLVEPGALLGQADRARLQTGAIGAGAVTLFHLWRRAGESANLHHAYYTRDPEAMVNACLGQAGHHLQIGLIPGFRVNLGGYVRYRSADWQLARLLGDGSDTAIGDDVGRALLAG